MSVASTRLHGVTYQKTAIFILSATKIENLACEFYDYICAKALTMQRNIVSPVF
jgi:hypothetical protein